jgi:hypothetical protein
MWEQNRGEDVTGGGGWLAKMAVQCTLQVTMYMGGRAQRREKERGGAFTYLIFGGDVVETKETVNLKREF